MKDNVPVKPEVQSIPDIKNKTHFILLDIDGVLNANFDDSADEFYREFKTVRVSKDNETKQSIIGYFRDDIIDRFKKIVADKDAVIILTSTWSYTVWVDEYPEFEKDFTNEMGKPVIFIDTMYDVYDRILDSFSVLETAGLTNKPLKAICLDDLIFDATSDRGIDVLSTSKELGIDIRIPLVHGSLGLTDKNFQELEDWFN